MTQTRRRIDHQHKPGVRRSLETGRIHELRRLISAGWSPAQPVDGYNPITLCDSTRALSFLIDAGADIDADFGHWSPVLYFSDVGNLEALKLLIRAGAKFDRPYTPTDCPQMAGGTTPLMRAASRGFLKVVKLLIQSGARINAVDEHGHNSLFAALRSNHVKLAKYLLKCGGKLTSDILCCPVRHGDVSTARLLISKGADVNQVFHRFDQDSLWPGKQTLLGYSIEQAGLHGYPLGMAGLLISAGADVNQKSEGLFASMVHGQFRVAVRRLTPLQLAGNRGMRTTIERLWKAGARGSLKHAMRGWSLERATYRDCPEVVKLLLEAGADVNAIGLETGKRPLKLAKERGSVEIAVLLKGAGGEE